MSAYYRQHYADNPEYRRRQIDKARQRQLEDPENWRRKVLRRKWGTTPEWYDSTLAEQDGVCAICHQECRTGRALAVDHDHTCCPGRVGCGKCNRGLLCMRCNQGLGLFLDDPALLETVIAYLRSHPAAGTAAGLPQVGSPQ